MYRHVSSSLIFTDLFSINDIEDLVENAHQQDVFLIPLQLAGGAGEDRCFGVLHLALELVVRFPFTKSIGTGTNSPFQLYREAMQGIVRSRFDLGFIDVADKGETKLPGLRKSSLYISMIRL